MDVRRRILERAWHGSGAVEDEARWLAARVRSGALAAERVELAACCDHPAAALALEGLGVPVSPTSWVTDVGRWGRDTCLRAAWLAALRALPVWESAFPRDGRPGRALRLAEDWLAGASGVEEEGSLVEATVAAEMAQVELSEAAELARSSAARLAEDACVSAYFALRCLQAVARESPASPPLSVPARWLRRRPARRVLSSQPPSVIDDFLTAERRTARARNEAPAVTRTLINSRVAAWCLQGDA